MIKTTRAQREALKLIYDRIVEGQKPSQRVLQYRDFLNKVAMGPDCIMVPFAGMWLGIEKDGYTHS